MPNEIEPGEIITDQAHLRDLLMEAKRQAKTGTEPSEDAAANLVRMIANTRTAPGDIHHFKPDGSLHGTTKRTAAVVSEIDVRSELPAFGNPKHLISALPTGTEAGKVSTLDKSIVEASAVLSSGVQLIVCDLEEDNKPLSLGNGEIGWQKLNRRFDTIDRAPFELLDGEHEEVTPHAPSITSEFIDTTDMKVFGTRVELTRAEQRRFASQGVMAAEVLTSFALGFGSTLDEMFLGARLTAPVPPWSLAALAAAGYDVPAVRAVVGTAATGAVVEPVTSELRVHGLPARMTAAMAETLVLVPSRSAIAIDSKIRVIAQRADKNGGLALTAIASAIPVLGASDVWQVTA